MPKIFGVGLNKTGTTTLGACMRHWGLHHMPFHPEPFDLWLQEDWPSLFKWADPLDSLADWPWALIWEPLDRQYPGSKFILTRRRDSLTWFQSLCFHAEMTGPTHYREAVYGYAMPHEHKAEHLAYYEAHLAAVRSYFADRPADLLEVCWEEGDGWDELAEFLGFDSPEIPFPHENKSG